MVVWRNEKLICDLHWGFCAYYDLATDPREAHNLAEERPERARRHARPARSTGSTATCASSRSSRAAPRTPRAGPCPKAIERGRLGDLLRRGRPRRAHDRQGAARRAARGRRSSSSALPPRRETADALARATSDSDAVIADWAAVGAVRLGDVPARARVKALVANARRRRAPARARARSRSRASATPPACPCSPRRSITATTCCSAALIIVSLGKLRDARAVPALLAHLPEVQNRREMVDALGEIGDRAGARRARGAASRRRVRPGPRARRGRARAARRSLGRWRARARRPARHRAHRRRGGA